MPPQGTNPRGFLACPHALDAYACRQDLDLTVTIMVIASLVIYLTHLMLAPGSSNGAHPARWQDPAPASATAHQRPTEAELECVDEARTRLLRLARLDKHGHSGLSVAQWSKALDSVVQSTYAKDSPTGGMLGAGAMPLTGGRAADFNAEGDIKGNNRIADLIARCQGVLNAGGVQRTFHAELSACGAAPGFLYLPHACIFRVDGADGPSFTNVYDGHNMPDAMCRDMVTLGLPWSFLQLNLHDQLFHRWENRASRLPIGQAFRLLHVVLALGTKYGEAMLAIRKLDEAGKLGDLAAVARRVAPPLKAYLESKGQAPKDFELARGHFLGTNQRIDLEVLQETLWMLYQADKLEAAITFALLQPKGSPDVPEGLRTLTNGDFGDWVRLMAATQTDLGPVLRRALEEVVGDFRVGTDLGLALWGTTGGVQAVLDQQIVIQGRHQDRRAFVAGWVQAELAAGGPDAEDAVHHRDQLRKADQEREKPEATANVWAVAGTVANQEVTRQLLRNRIRASQAFLRAIDRASKK